MNIQDMFSLDKQPTVINGMHESLYRSYFILNIVEELLKHNTPALVVLNMLSEMRMVDGKEMKYDGARFFDV